MDDKGNIYNGDGVFIGTANTEDIQNEEVVENPLWQKKVLI